jgi:hypothetical protein
VGFIVRSRANSLKYAHPQGCRPKSVCPFALTIKATRLKEKLIKIGAKVVSHARYVAFQMAEVAITRNLFADILRLIAELRPPPVTSTV